MHKIGTIHQYGISLKIAYYQKGLDQSEKNILYTFNSRMM